MGIANQYLMEKYAEAKDSEIEDKLRAIDRLEFNSKAKASEYAPPWLNTIGAPLAAAAIYPAGVRVPAALASLGTNLVGNLIARTVGKLRKPRTNQEQFDYEHSNKWKNWLLPFMAEYNKGRSIKHYQNRREQVIQDALLNEL